jgi:hypothetical protein
MFKAATAASAVITPVELDGTVGVLRSFDRPDLVTKLLAHYVDLPGRAPQFFALQGPFSQYVQDEELKAAFADKYVLPDDVRAIFEVLGKMVEHSGWNPADITRLVQFTEDQYYEAVRDYVGRDLNAMIKFALSLRAHDHDMKVVAERMEAAVRRLAGEGEVEARRARLFGIEPAPAAAG